MKQAIALGPSSYGSLTSAEYKKYRDLIGGSRHDADDHMQELSIRALQMCNEGLSESVVDALDSLVLTNSHAKRRDNRTIHTAPDKLDMIRHRAHALNPVSTQEVSEDRDIWTSLEASIPAMYTDIAHMRIDEGKTNKQIASETGLHIKTVGYRYEEFCRRARKIASNLTLLPQTSPNQAALIAA